MTYVPENGEFPPTRYPSWLEAKLYVNNFASRPVRSDWPGTFASGQTEEMQFVVGRFGGEPLAIFTEGNFAGRERLVTVLTP